MTLRDLEIGQEVQLEFKFGEGTYNITSQVQKVMSNTVMFLAHAYQKGKIIFLDTKKQDIRVNVIVNDIITKKRYGWENVSITTMDEGYFTVTQVESSTSVDLNRRLSERYVYRHPCEVYSGRNVVNAMIEDISETGIRLTMTLEDAIKVQKEGTIMFKEHPYGNDFIVAQECNVDFRVARRVPESPEKFTLGCIISYRDKNFDWVLDIGKRETKRLQRLEKIKS